VRHLVCLEPPRGHHHAQAPTASARPRAALIAICRISGGQTLWPTSDVGAWLSGGALLVPGRRLVAVQLRRELVEQVGHPLADGFSDLAEALRCLRASVGEDLGEAVVGGDVPELLVRWALGRSRPLPRGPPAAPARGPRWASRISRSMVREARIGDLGRGAGAWRGALGASGGAGRSGGRGRAGLRAAIARRCRICAYASWISSKRRADSGEPALWSGWWSCTSLR
jgi:hypothetical protein